jgi:hypothetical protein
MSTSDSDIHHKSRYDATEDNHAGSNHSQFLCFIVVNVRWAEYDAFPLPFLSLAEYFTRL